MLRRVSFCGKSGVKVLRELVSFCGRSGVKVLEMKPELVEQLSLMSLSQEAADGKGTPALPSGGTDADGSLDGYR